MPLGRAGSFAGTAFFAIGTAIAGAGNGPGVATEAASTTSAINLLDFIF
jgi:hypothetical protein